MIMMKKFFPNTEGGGMSRSRQHGLRGVISVLLAVLGIALEWLACAQTNVSMEFVGRWQPPDARMVNGVSVVGDLAYIGTGDSLEIIDISDPRNPTWAGHYVTDGLVYSVQVVGNHAFLAVLGRDDSIGRGLQIIDVSNPQMPVRIGGVRKGDTSDLEVVGQYAYVADYHQGLEIYNVSNPTNAVMVARLSFGGNPEDIRVLGGFAYLAGQFGGLSIVNIENPAQPFLAGSFRDGGATWDVDVAGNYAFLANIYNGLVIVDVSNPTEPRHVATLASKGHPTGVHVVQSRVFVTDYDGGVQVIDVSAPARPVLVGSLPMSGSSRAVDVVGSYAYVADSTGGLDILNIAERPLGISEQPNSRQVETGQTAVFIANAVSVAPFTYQWRTEGSNLADGGRISGATTSTLVISNAMASDQGCYSAVVSNAFGAVASSNACLTVVPGLREALDDTNQVWNTSGTRPWRLQFAETHDGADAAEGGPLQAGIVGEANSISTRVVGPGQLSFWWKLEDAECFQLSLQLGAGPLATIGPWNSGATNWESQTVTIPAGAQDLKWVFQTFCGCDSPSGRAWLDEVEYTPAPALTIPNQKGDALTLEVTGPMGTNVQAEISTNLLSWTPLASPRLTLANGRGVLQVPKPDSKAFYRVVIVP